MQFMNRRALVFLAIFAHACESVKIASEFHNFMYHNPRAPLSPFQGVRKSTLLLREVMHCSVNTYLEAY